MKQFELEGYEFIELNKLLKFLSVTNTGGEANALITNGEVQVNGQTELQKRKKLRKGDIVKVNGETIEIV